MCYILLPIYIPFYFIYASDIPTIIMLNSSVFGSFGF